MSAEVRELKSRSSASKSRSALVEMCSVPEKVNSHHIQLLNILLYFQHE